MKKITLFKLIAISFLILSIASCKKDNNTNTDPNPTPVIKPDTLSAGWTKITIKDEAFADIFFQNNLVGYVLGKYLYKTADGGNTWARSAASLASSANLAVTTDGKVFVAGNTNIMYRSTDGGTSFSTINFTYGKVDDILFIDNNTGYAPYQGGLLQTTDGGITLAPPAGPVTGLNFSGAVYQTAFFINASTGWIANGTDIYKSNGNINTWVKSIFSGTTSGAAASLYAVSSTLVYVGFNDGKIFKSVDGGLNFSPVAGFTNNVTFLDIHFTDANNGYASYATKIYKTTDGGTSWQTVVSLGQGVFSEIHFTDATHGWACTSDGGIIKLN